MSLRETIDIALPKGRLGEQVYDSFLKSYGQDLGVRSYGAVVDLLVAYYDGVLLTAA